MEHKTRPKGISENPGRSIAVLPFVNMSSDPENEYFSDGITEEIINALAKIKELRVTSRTSAFFYKGKQLPITQIGQELNVATILEGSVRLSGQTMRITAQLIQAADDYHYWSETFDRSTEDIFAVQDEISLLIADKLRENTHHFEIGEQLVPHLQIPFPNYQLYLKGRHLLQKLTLEDVEEGIETMKAVIAAQPDFAPAYLGINQGYAYLGTMGMLPAQESFAKAKPFLDKALELDTDLPESQVNLAWIACWQNWDIDATYHHLNKALAIRPDDTIYITFANILSIEGKFAASHHYIDKALQIAPFEAINIHFKGFIYYLEERYEEAIPYFQKSLELKPGLGFPILYWGLALLAMGKPKKALQHFQSLGSDHIDQLGGTTLCHAALGNVDQIEQGMSQLESTLQSEAMGKAMIFLIQVHVQLGNPVKALALIAKAIEMRLPTTLLLYTEPLLKPLRADGQFQSLMRTALGERTNFDLPKKRYKTPLLSPQLKDQYRHQLNTLMDEESPFLDPSLTIRTLAATMDIPANHLSQLLNEGYQQNFAEFINTHRLKTFKSIAADPGYQHLSLLGLAFESGFNSKTVFNTFFKKMEGKTPKAYWKEVNNQ